MSVALFEETEDFLADLIKLNNYTIEEIVGKFQQVIESDLLNSNIVSLQEDPARSSILVKILERTSFFPLKSTVMQVNKRNSYVFIQNSMNFQACKTRLLLDVKE